MSARVALATCGEFPQLAEDDPLLLEELRRRGIEAEPAVWDDPAVGWSGFDLVVIRSTWDYVSRRDGFVRWARELPRVLNSAEVIAWNTDKRYLGELPHTVSTDFVTRASEFRPPAGEFVIKPTISAGSRDTARYGPGDEEAACRHVRELLDAGRTAMVQPYLASVDVEGETALIFFGGSYSHAIRKGQILQRASGLVNGLYANEDIAAREPRDTERAVAEEILDALPWPRRDLLYARVDLIHDEHDAPKLVELELTEPSLFLSYGEGAVERLATELESRL